MVGGESEGEGDVWLRAALVKEAGAWGFDTLQLRSSSLECICACITCDISLQNSAGISARSIQALYDGNRTGVPAWMSIQALVVFPFTVRSTRNDPSAGFIIEASVVNLGASGSGFRSLIDRPVSRKFRGPIMFPSVPV
ncbi:hypothetical protein E2C01_101669 [Portunus trituberculatus]|uniref:Uncharacterized protein n=1 Tax=Portunus trituberculatus TaxID=210409 RepID=A0A5B7KGM6_PORTR|nr:hypothetical protein [Portunus trituberculatus]